MGNDALHKLPTEFLVYHADSIALSFLAGLQEEKRVWKLSDV